MASPPSTPRKTKSLAGEYITPNTSGILEACVHGKLLFTVAARFGLEERCIQNDHTWTPP